jgi:4-hydroxy-3-polyprenylbenzoate decarboxylase
MRAEEVNDLRTALELLGTIPGELVSTSVEVDPEAELAAVYRKVGAGVPVQPPAPAGPARRVERV